MRELAHALEKLVPQFVRLIALGLRGHDVQSAGEADRMRLVSAPCRFDRAAIDAELAADLCRGAVLRQQDVEPFARGALDPAEVVSIARQMALALAAVHDRGVIHADVTPGNALVVAADPIHVKLVDFGLAAIAGEGMAEEESAFVLGTPAYISPEQLRGLPATDRSDQYGLGCVLFELLTGAPPYMHEEIRQLCLMHVQAPIPVAESPHGPLPPKLADVITTCLQKSPQARFPGMRAMLAALDEVERVTDRRGWRRWLSS